MTTPIHAPPLQAAELPWFNTPRPLDIPDLKGKLVILDFWTYCCINCIHVIPTLKRLESRFARSLAVIGVHSPKFPGERVADNVRQAVARYEIAHPVVHDADCGIWRRYAVRAWPTLVFIDPSGHVLGQMPGEPDPRLLESSLASLLEDFERTGKLSGKALDFSAAPPRRGTTLLFPGKIAFSPEDNEFAIADANHNQIVTADRQGRITRRIGSGLAGKRDSDCKRAEFCRPQGLAYRQGNIWVADTENHLLRQIDLAAGRVLTAAGTGEQGPFLQGQGMGLRTALSSPWDVAIDGDRLFFANAGTHQIGAFYPRHDLLQQFAGTGHEALLDGPRLRSAFAQPSGLSLGGGRLFVADSETSAVRSIRLDGSGMVATHVGTGLFDFGDRDGAGTAALLQHPLGVCHANGKVYIADSYNHKIKTLDLASQEVRGVEPAVSIVCAETGCAGLWEPAGVLVAEGCLYVADTNNHRILRIDPQAQTAAVFIQ